MKNKIEQLKQILPKISDLVAGLKKEGPESLCGPCPICGQGKDRFVLKTDSGRCWTRSCGCIPESRPWDTVDFHAWKEKTDIKGLIKKYLPEKKQVTYDYPDIDGNLIHQTVRSRGKKFFQRRPDGLGGWINKVKDIRQILYNLKAVPEAQEVIILEGEKDADNLIRLGFVATTCAGGAKSWKPEYCESLKGKDIILIPDNDTPGREHMEQVAKSLDGIAASIKIIELPGLPEKGDVSNFINTFEDRDQAAESLALLIENAEPWELKKRPQDKKTSFIAAELMQIDFPEPKWAIPDILPEGLNFLAGKPKQGKSVMALNICLAVATGGKALGKDVIQGSVIYLALEDTGRRLQYRIGQMLHDAPAPDGLHIFTQWPRMGEGGILQIESEVEKHDNLRLLVIDTLAKFKPISAEKNQARYDIDYQTVSRIKDIADKYFVPVLLISHQRKSEADDIFDTISGTLGLTGAADGILVLARKTGQDMAELHLVGRDVDAAEYALSYDPSIWTWTLLGDAQEIKNTRDQQTLYDALKKHTDQNNLMTPKELSEITGLKASYIKATLPRLIQQGNVYKRGRGNYFYRLETY